MSTEPVPSGSAQSSEEATVAEPRIRSETEAPSRGSSGPLPLQNSEGSSWARVRVLAMAEAADLMSRWDDVASRGPRRSSPKGVGARFAPCMDGEAGEWGAGSGFAVESAVQQGFAAVRIGPEGSCQALADVANCARLRSLRCR